MQRASFNHIVLVIAVLLLAVGGPWLVREVRSLPRPAALAERAGQRIVTIDVGGMTCGACAAKVKHELTALPGVSTAEVRLAEKRAYVVCDRAVADTAITGAVGRAGPGFLAAIATR